MSITYPSGTSLIINEIRGAIGRNISFNRVVSRSGCSACSLDPVTGTSTDSFCSVCGGEYWIETISGTNVNAHVHWRGVDQEQHLYGGRIYDGDCTAQIEYTENNLTILEESETVIVDDKELSISRKILKGVPTLNRIVLILSEE